VNIAVMPRKTVSTNYHILTKCRSCCRKHNQPIWSLLKEVHNCYWLEP